MDYFRKNKAAEIKECMLIERRIACNLRLDLYTQNANECMNRLIKQNLNGKLGLKDFIDHAQKVIDKQGTDAELATIGRIDGLRLAPPYMNLFLVDGDYGKLNPDERRRHTHRIHTAALAAQQLCGPAPIE